RDAVDRTPGCEHAREIGDLRSLAVEQVAVFLVAERVVRLPVLDVAVVDARVGVARMRFGGEEVDPIDAVAPIFIVSRIVSLLRAGREAASVGPRLPLV